MFFVLALAALAERMRFSLGDVVDLNPDTTQLNEFYLKSKVAVAEKVIFCKGI